MNHCNLSFKAVEWIDGELLGDGCVYSRSTHSANFVYKSKHLEYIEYVSKTLSSFGILQTGKINKMRGVNAYAYTSLYYPELLPIRMHWYPEGKKVVPRDIKLTPLTCRQWYIGDGCLRKTGCIILATYGFLVEDVKFLVNQLQELGFLAIRQPSTNVIRIANCSTKDFLRYVGASPVECYKYKWDI